MVAVLESPPEFAAKKTGAKKSQKCNPGKSHSCVRVDGTMYCISLSRKCRMGATGSAKNAADYIAKNASAGKSPKRSAPTSKAVPTAKYSGDDFIKKSSFGERAEPPTSEDLVKQFKGVTVIENDKDGPGAMITSLRNGGGDAAEIKQSAEKIAAAMNQLSAPPTDDRLPPSLKKERNAPAIKSQDEFDQALDRVIGNPDFGGEIYALRRSLGSRVSRSDFDRYLLSAQANDKIQLHSGSLEYIYPEGILDSVATEMTGLRTRIKRPADFAEMPQSFAEIEIEILPKGTHTSNSGYQFQATDRELDELVETYNPKNFQAPLIITHDTKGLGDTTLANSEFSYGVPKALKRVGDTVKAVFDKVAPEFESWVRDKKLLTVSPSFYLANSPGNPTPGKLALRHIAALGATPPAIKSLAPLSSAFNFGEDDEGVISIDFDAGAIDFDCGCGDGYINSGLWQRLRDWLIDQYGLETADKIIPGYEVGILTERRLDNPLMERLHELEEKVFGQESPAQYSEMTANKTTETTDAVDFSAKEQEFAARELKIAAQEAALRVKEFTSFCENDLKDRLTPGMAATAEVVAFMEYLHNPASLVEFSAGEATSPIDWFKGFLTKLPTAVEFGELAKEVLISPTPSIAGTWDGSELDKDAKIRAWCKENGKDAENHVDYAAGMKALGIFY